MVASGCRALHVVSCVIALLLPLAQAMRSSQDDVFESVAHKAKHADDTLRQILQKPGGNNSSGSAASALLTLSSSGNSTSGEVALEKSPGPVSILQLHRARQGPACVGNDTLGRFGCLQGCSCRWYEACYLLRPPVQDEPAPGDPGACKPDMFMLTIAAVGLVATFMVSCSLLWFDFNALHACCHD
eukprot:TRINITY_DN41230_c0_g1_i1.p1 TRINITY_DN41230_c0_g1~~TRINITY_DN41230_c0_g1_i1.p1  ORF type:complete len:186 (-),score=22.02 TRINITY_DN41230_c0_g1_i1:242-799(-)